LLSNLLEFLRFEFMVVHLLELINEYRKITFVLAFQSFFFLLELELELESSTFGEVGDTGGFGF